VVNLKARSAAGAIGGLASGVQIHDAERNAVESEAEMSVVFFPIHALGLQSSCARSPVVKVDEADEEPPLVVTWTAQKYLVSDFSAGPEYSAR
jgi:hypothetical protein